MQHGRTVNAVAAVAIIVAVALLSLSAPRLLTVLGATERWLADLRVSMLAPPEPQHPDIVILALTEETLSRFPYRSPIDRAFLAELVRWLTATKVRAIGIDILFDQPTESVKDEALRAAIAAAPMPVVVAYAQPADGLTEQQRGFLDRFVAGFELGIVALFTDPADGTVRWIYPGRMFNGAPVRGFAPAIAAALGARPSDQPAALAYRRSPEAGMPPFRVFPAHLAMQLPPRWFAGKIVLIGSDRPDSDRHRTPMAAAVGAEAGQLPGVVIHAHALAQILDERQAPRTSFAIEAAVTTALAAAGLIAAFAAIGIGLQVTLAAALLLALWTAGLAVSRMGLPPLPLVSPSLALLLGFGLGTAYCGGRARRGEAFIRDAFSRFTAPSVVEALIADPGRLRLGGEKREVSCVFSDLAGFTAMIEQGDPAVVLPAMNAYLDGMCRIVFDHGGTIMKIVGDAIHVMFGAPLEHPDHPRRALLCGLQLAAFGRAFSRQQHDRGLAFGLTRVGVHTGPAMVGNFGGERFFDYTAHGDAINTAARLETANKDLGTLICVSAVTAGRCPEFRYRPIGTLKLPGKSNAVDVLEPFLPGTLPPQSAEDYAEAYARLKAGDVTAAAVFSALAVKWPDDPLIGLHAGRLAAGEAGTMITMKGK